MYDNNNPLSIDTKDNQDVVKLENGDGLNNCFDKDSQGSPDACINDDHSFEDGNKFGAIVIIK